MQVGEFLAFGESQVGCLTSCWIQLHIFTVRCNFHVALCIQPSIHSTIQLALIFFMNWVSLMMPSGLLFAPSNIYWTQQFHCCRQNTALQCLSNCVLIETTESFSNEDVSAQLQKHEMTYRNIPQAATLAEDILKIFRLESVSSVVQQDL